MTKKGPIQSSKAVLDQPGVVEQNILKQLALSKAKKRWEPDKLLHYRDIANLSKNNANNAGVVTCVLAACWLEDGVIKHRRYNIIYTFDNFKTNNINCYNDKRTSL